MDVSVLDRTREAKGLTVRQLSALASVAPSTTSRILRGEVQPTVETFESLIAALGLTLTLTDAVDARAITTARWFCGDIAIDRPDPEWERRFTALRCADNIGELCWRASTYAPFPQRATVSVNVADIASLLDATRKIDNADWAWTGSTAADLYSGNPAGTGQAWIYASDPASFAANLPTSADPGLRVLIAPLDDTAAAAQVDVGGNRLVAPLQTVIDCFSGPGRMADQAWAVLERLGVRYDR